MKTALYRHFDQAGTLLYVGISMHPFHRTTQHVDRSAWAESIARIELTHFDSRAAAEQAELLAIRTERPLFNRAARGGFDRWAIVSVDGVEPFVDGWYAPADVLLEMLAYHRAEWPARSFRAVRWGDPETFFCRAALLSSTAGEMLHRLHRSAA